MSYSAAQIWLIIGLLGIGTYLIRLSFLGLIGDRPMPPVLLRLLRYTPVAVLPAMVAPLVVSAPVAGAGPDPMRFLAAGVTIVVGMATRNVLWAILAGILSFYGPLAFIALS